MVILLDTIFFIGVYRICAAFRISMKNIEDK